MIKEDEDGPFARQQGHCKGCLFLNYRFVAVKIFIEPAFGI